MKHNLGIIVGIRQLHEAGPRRRVVVVRIGRPRKAKGVDWECPYHIRGLGTRKIQYAYGIDAIQALLLAIEGIRTALQKSGRQLSWAGGEPGDTGFTRLVPTFFGLVFSRKLDRLIDREVERFARAIENRRRRGLAKPVPVMGE